MNGALQALIKSYEKHCVFGCSRYLPSQ